METYPKISIITPNLNGEKFLEQTILSVLSQNYPNLEYIIIDGGSIDGSIEIIKKYEHRLSYWISESDNGLYDAIQKGFDHSTGDIMAWVNSDDMYHSKSFFTVAEIFSNFQQVKWLQGIPSYFDTKDRTVSVGNLRDWSKFDFYKGQYQWIQQESTFWKRELWEIAGNRIAKEMKYAGDFELWLRFFRHEDLYVTSALLAGFRQRTGQLSSLYSEEYLHESNTILQNELQYHLSSNDKKRLRLYLYVNKLTTFVLTGKLKIKLNTIINQLFFANVPRIHFDSTLNRFIISK